MAGSSGLALAGVEAIVEGLGKFQGDIRSMNSALDSIRPRSTLLQRAFSGTWEAVKDFGREILNVAEYALGHLLADAIQWIIGKLGELVSATIDAGNEFQTLELRLQGLNVDALTKSGMAYNKAAEEAVRLTKEQLEWLQKLAAQTPYDNTDISNIYTLARTYGFADDASKELTESVVDFASGMGLGSEALERVVVNLGQMVQRGKITSTEMRDLARGAFLPLDDILQRIADDLNASGEGLADNSGEIEEAQRKLQDYNRDMEVLLQREAEFTDTTKESTRMQLANQMAELQAKIDDTTASMGALQTKSGKLTVADIMKEISKPGGGLPAELFIDAFNEMVQEEDRFKGAAERMAKTFKAAGDNAADMVKSIGGLNIVKPILDAVGSRLSEFTSAFTDNPARWNQLTAAATRVGEALTSIVEGVFGLLPGAESLADRVVSAVNGIADWITDHKDDILGFFIGIGNTIREDVIPWIQDKLIPFFQRIAEWVSKNAPLISEFFKTLGEILTTVFGNLTQGLGEGDGTGDFLNTITEFMKYVIANKEKIAEWVEIIIRAIATWQILATTWNIVLTGIIGLVGWIISFVGVVLTLSSVISTLISILAVPFVAVLTLIGASIAYVAGMFTLFGAIAKKAVEENFLGMGAIINAFLENVKATLTAFGAWLQGDTERAKQVLSDAWNNSLTALQTTFNEKFAGIIDAVKTNVGLLEVVFSGGVGGMVMAWETGIEAIQDILWILEEFFVARIEKITSLFTETNWIELGTSIIEGITRGVYAAGSTLLQAVLSIARDAVESAKEYLGIASPSKVFEAIGVSTMEGFAQGIQRAAGVAAGAVQGVLSQATMPALTMSAAVAGASGSNYSTENNYNLSILSNSNTEPIVQDFKMLQAMQGI